MQNFNEMSFDDFYKMRRKLPVEFVVLLSESIIYPLN